MAETISNPTEQRVTLKDGRTLGFAEYGDPKGEPLLEFHGCPSCRFEARSYDEAGKKLGVRVISIDRPGFGISTFVKGYRTVDWPADVIEFADALGLNRFSVAGISSGSPYALACARFIPERLHGCSVVSGLPPLTVKGEKIDRKQFLIGAYDGAAGEGSSIRRQSDIPILPVADPQRSGPRHERNERCHSA